MVYHLDPSFPLRDVTARRGPDARFTISSSTYSEFDLAADVAFTDGSTARLTHRVTLPAPPVNSLPLAEALRAQVRFGNTARSQAAGRNVLWTIYLEPAPALAERIAAVDYLLHPTFTQRLIRVSADRAPTFQFSFHGWGKFEVLITVTFADGSRLQTSHMLTDGGSVAPPRPPAPRPHAPRPPSPTQAATVGPQLHFTNSAQPIGSGQFRWTIWCDSAATLTGPVRRVRYTLHPTFRPQVQEDGDRSRGFALTQLGWGTFRINIEVQFQDLSVHRTVHDLRF